MPETDYSYTSSGNNKELVRQIKQYALFLYAKDEGFTLPTGVDWTPGDKSPIGYSSEDGAVLHPEAGDDTEITAHNGDIVISTNSGGYWTLQLAGIEARKQVVEAYFGTTVAADGGIHVADATTPQKWGLVLAALDQDDRPIVVGAAQAQVSDRDDVTLVSSDVLQFNMTFKLFKTNNEMFVAYGMVLDDTSDSTDDETDTGETTVAVENVTLSPDTGSVAAGESLQLTATVEPDDATDPTVTFTSSDEEKATVDDSGLVTALAGATGEVTITATAAGGKTATATVTITAPGDGE